MTATTHSLLADDGARHEPGERPHEGALLERGSGSHVAIMTQRSPAIGTAGVTVR